MKTITPAEMLQIGFDCGLTTVSEAYSAVMMHYDCFFLIEKITEQVQAFNEKLGELGLLDCYLGKCKFKAMSIEEAAAKIGYALNTEPLELPPAEGEIEPELFSLADLEEGHDLEHILGKKEYEEDR